MNEVFLSRFDIKCFQSLCQLFLLLRFSQFFSLSRNQQASSFATFVDLFVFVSPCLQILFRCIARSTKQTWKSCFCFFTDGKQHKARELDMITLRNHAPRSYMAWLLVTLSVLDMIVLSSSTRWCPRRWFRKFTVRFRPIKKEIVSSFLWLASTRRIDFGLQGLFPMLINLCLSKIISSCCCLFLLVLS